MDRYVVHIKKTRGSQRRDELFGFLRKTIHGYVAGSLKQASLFYSFGRAEDEAATFALLNPIYSGRVEVRKALNPYEK